MSRVGGGGSFGGGGESARGVSGAHVEASSQQEQPPGVVEMEKLRQNDDMAVVSRTLDRLKDAGAVMGEELERQDVLIERVSDHTAQLRGRLQRAPTTGKLGRMGKEGKDTGGKRSKSSGSGSGNGGSWSGGDRFKSA